MNTACLFESNSPELTAIWNHGTALYEEVQKKELKEILLQPMGFPMYFSVTLFLSGDSQVLRELLLSAAKLLKGQLQNEKYHEAILTYPMALEDFLHYTVDQAYVEECADEIDKLMAKVAEMHADECRMQALYIGGVTVMQRIRAKCNLPIKRAEVGQMIRAFHDRWFDTVHYQYRSTVNQERILIAAIAGAFDFVADDGYMSVKKMLLEDAFELSREWQGLLFRALANMEVNEAFLSCVLEGGLPTCKEGAASLCGLDALIRHLISVDIEMLGKEIVCMSPRLPEHMLYTLCLPSKYYTMFYEGGIG